MKTDGQLYCYKPVKKALFLNARTPPFSPAASPWRRSYVSKVVRRDEIDERKWHACLCRPLDGCPVVETWFAWIPNIPLMRPEGRVFFWPKATHRQKMRRDDWDKKKPFVVCLPIVSLSGRTNILASGLMVSSWLNSGKIKSKLRMQIQETILNF